MNTKLGLSAFKQKIRTSRPEQNVPLQYIEKQRL